MRRISIAIAYFLCIVSTVFAYTSLQVNDPRNGGLWARGTINQAKVTITPQGNYMLYEMELELGVGKVSHSQTYDSLEITCNFDLPAGAYVKSAALLIGSEWITADIMSRKEAHAIYEGFVKRRIDPLIIYKNYGDSYLFKIFPISPSQSRTMRLSYVMPILSNNGFETAGLLTGLFKASENPVDVKVLIKKTSDFPNPISNNTVFTDSKEQSGYVEATISSTNITSISSSKKTEPILFSSSTNTNNEITYSLSFKPQDLFTLEDPKKYIFIIDNDPQIIQDSIYSYQYTETGYERQFNKTRTIKPITNEVLYNELKNMLNLTNVGDQCKVYIKNNSVFVSDWITITPQNIEILIQSVSENDNSYKANIKELLLAAKSDIELENATTILISNNKQMMYKPFDEIQTEAQSIAAQLNLSKSIHVWDISALYNDTDAYYYFSNRFVSQLSYVLQTTNRYYYSNKVYYISDFVQLFNQIKSNTTSKILLLNVSTRSNDGVIFDKYTPNNKSYDPNFTYTELGKITKGSIFLADISFLYKGKRYNGSYQFPIDSAQNIILEGAWAVKIVDVLNEVYSEESKKEAESISTANSVLTQNTAMLAIEPGVEITPCYNCPDWNNTRWMFDDMMIVPFEMTGISNSIEYYGGYDSYSYDEGFNDGMKYSEESIDTVNTQSYDNGYAAGYADGVFNCNAADQKDSNIEAYPTEFSNELKVIVYSNKPQLVEVYSAQGILLESFTITKAKELNNSNSVLFSLPSGTYIFKTTIDGVVSYATVFKK